MEAAALEEVRQNVREAVVGSIDAGLTLLLDVLPADRPKHRQLLLLRGRLHGLVQYQVNNTLAADKILVLENELRQDVLLFAEHLSLADFTEGPAGRPELRPGHLLYQIPDRMKVRERHPCRVRIAHRLSQLLENLDPALHHEIEDIPVAEVMEVEIIDPSAPDNPAFDVLLVSDGEQFVDEYSYTEWVFYVRPLRAGAQELILKVSVLITVNDKERTKNLVFTRSIQVGTQAETDPPLRRVAAEAPISGGAADAIKEFHEEEFPPPIQGKMDTKKPGGGPPPVPDTAPAPKRSGQPWMKIAAAVVFLVVATFLLLPDNNIDVDPVTPTDVGSEPIIMTRRNNTEVATGQQWENTRKRLLEEYRKNPEQKLIIYGNYYPDETAPPGYENMGELRAEKIRDLLEGDIPREAIETRTNRKEEASLTKDKVLEAGSFRWRQAPVEPAEEEGRKDERLEDSRRVTSPRRVIIPQDTATRQRQPPGQ